MGGRSDIGVTLRSEPAGSMTAAPLWHTGMLGTMSPQTSTCGAGYPTSTGPHEAMKRGNATGIHLNQPAC